GRARGPEAARHARARLRRGRDLRDAAGSAAAHRRDGPRGGRRAARSVPAPGRRAVGTPCAAGARRATRAAGAGAEPSGSAPRAGLEAVMRMLRLPISLAVAPYLVLQSLRQSAINARRRDRTARYLAWSAAAGVLAAVMIALASAFVVFLWSV